MLLKWKVVFKEKGALTPEGLHHGLVLVTPIGYGYVMNARTRGGGGSPAPKQAGFGDLRKL